MGVSVEEVLARAKPRTAQARINLDPEILEEIAHLRDELRKAKRQDQLAGEGLDARAPQLERRLLELQEQADQQATVFGLSAIRGEDFDGLKRRCPVTEPQWQRYREEAKASPFTAQAPEFNYDEMFPRLIGRTVVSIDGEPVDWSEEDGIQLWAELTDGARADLGKAAWDVNSRSSIRPTYGTVTDTTPSFGPESTTPPQGESHSQSS